MSNNTAVKLDGILMSVVGIGMLVASACFLVYNIWFWATAKSTEGEVVGWEDMETRPGIRPISEKRAQASRVRFFNESGDEIFFASDVGSESGLHSKGEKVIVLYRPNDLENAKIRDLKSLYLGPLLRLPLVRCSGSWACW